ncbi:MAG TPA: universal stress protein [Hyphomicrobiaceae bacterium]|nr:universal stress protein [Hyphomicrobiaceae bacterium]
MTIKSVFLFTPAELTQADRGPAAYAISLARTASAHLTIFTVALDVTTPGQHTDAAAVGLALSRAADAAGVRHTLVTKHSHAIGVHEAIAEHARLHDVSVLGSSLSGLLSEKQITESLLFESGRPAIVVPGSHSAPFRCGTVAAAWDNTGAAARALGDALALLRPERMHLLTITGEKPVSTDIGNASLVELLARRGVAADHSVVPLGNRTIAAALQDEAIDRRADLLCMGAYGHSRFRRFVFGSATADLLRNSKMPTLLSH